MPIRLGGGGGPFALGLEPPKKSATFSDPGNTFPKNTSGTITVSYYDRGRLAPLPDNDTEDLALNILSNTKTRFSMARGRRRDRTTVWAITGSNLSADNLTINAVAYDMSAGLLYVLVQNTTAATNQLYSINLSNGFTALLGNVATGNQASTGVGTGVVNGQQITFYFNIGSNLLQRIVVDTSGAIIEPLSLADSGGNLTLARQPFYVTADESLLVTELSAVGDPDARTGPTFLRMVLVRGATQKAVMLPYDGAAPFAAHNLLIDTGEGYSLEQLGNFPTYILPWGDSVVFIANSLIVADPQLEPIYGRKVVDRADFDRWLHEIADFYGLPAGVPYW